MKRLYYWYDLNFEQNNIIARSRQEAQKQLLIQGKVAIKFKAGRFISSKSFSRNELLLITKQIATLLKAGLSLIDALELLIEDQTKAHWQYLLNDVKSQITQGETLSQALANHHLVFPSLYCQIIATGELTGQLDTSFEQLSLQLERSIELHKRIKKAVRYPLFLLVVSLVVALVMLLVVLPKFNEIYQSFDAQLPYFTQCMIELSASLERNWIILSFILLLSYLTYQHYVKARFQAEIDRWILRLPLIGQLITSSHLTQIFQTLAITQQAGIPLLTGLNSAVNTASNAFYQDSINLIIEQIKQGQSFSYALRQQAGYPNICRQLVHAGEESGTLDLMLDNLAHYFQQQHQRLTDNLSSTLEPLLMLLLSLIVGSLIMAIYLPIFQLGDVIH